MKKNKKYFIFFSAVVLFVTFLFSIKYLTKEKEFSDQGNPIRETVMGKSTYKLEVVENQEKMAKGLGGRKSLCARCGMVFIFPKSERHSFWMKGMEIPLDIFWLYGNNIVHIEKNVPADRQGTMNPDVISDKVIELGAGAADEMGIEVGAGVIFHPNEIYP